MSTQRHLMMAAAAASFIALGAREAWGQWNVTRFDSSTTWAYTSYGLDPAVMGSIGFARSIPQFRESLVSAEVGWVVAGFDAARLSRARDRADIGRAVAIAAAHG